jgi:hypothetical protein
VRLTPLRIGVLSTEACRFSITRRSDMSGNGSRWLDLPDQRGIPENASSRCSVDGRSTNCT